MDFPNVSRVSSGQILGQQKVLTLLMNPKAKGREPLRISFLSVGNYVAIASTNRLWSSPLVQRSQARNFIQLD